MMQVKAALPRTLANIKAEEFQRCLKQRGKDLISASPPMDSSLKVIKEYDMNLPF